MECKEQEKGSVHSCLEVDLNELSKAKEEMERLQVLVLERCKKKRQEAFDYEDKLPKQEPHDPNALPYKVKHEFWQQCVNDIDRASAVRRKRVAKRKDVEAALQTSLPNPIQNILLEKCASDIKVELQSLKGRIELWRDWIKVDDRLHASTDVITSEPSDVHTLISCMPVMPPILGSGQFLSRSEDKLAMSKDFSESGRQSTMHQVWGSIQSLVKSAEDESILDRHVKLHKFCYQAHWFMLIRVEELMQNPDNHFLSTIRLPNRFQNNSLLRNVASLCAGVQNEAKIALKKHLGSENLSDCQALRDGCDACYALLTVKRIRYLFSVEPASDDQISEGDLKQVSLIKGTLSRMCEELTSEKSDGQRRIELEDSLTVLDRELDGARDINKLTGIKVCHAPFVSEKLRKTFDKLKRLIPKAPNNSSQDSVPVQDNVPIASVPREELRKILSEIEREIPLSECGGSAVGANRSDPVSRALRCTTEIASLIKAEVNKKDQKIDVLPEFALQLRGLMDTAEERIPLRIDVLVKSIQDLMFDACERTMIHAHLDAIESLPATCGGELDPWQIRTLQDATKHFREMLHKKARKSMESNAVENFRMLLKALAVNKSFERICDDHKSLLQDLGHHFRHCNDVPQCNDQPSIESRLSLTIEASILKGILVTPCIEDPVPDERKLVAKNAARFQTQHLLDKWDEQCSLLHVLKSQVESYCGKHQLGSSWKSPFIQKVQAILQQGCLPEKAAIQAFLNDFEPTLLRLIDTDMIHTGNGHTIRVLCSVSCVKASSPTKTVEVADDDIRQSLCPFVGKFTFPDFVKNNGPQKEILNAVRVLSAEEAEKLSEQSRPIMIRSKRLQGRLFLDDEINAKYKDDVRRISSSNQPQESKNAEIAMARNEALQRERKLVNHSNILDHVIHGSKKTFKSIFISCSIDMNVIMKFATPFDTVVLINLTKALEGRDSKLEVRNLTSEILETDSDVRDFYERALRSQEILIFKEAEAQQMMRPTFVPGSVQCWPRDKVFDSPILRDDVLQFPTPQEFENLPQMIEHTPVTIGGPNDGVKLICFKKKPFLLVRPIPNVGSEGEMISEDMARDQLRVMWTAAAICRALDRRQHHSLPVRLYEYEVTLNDEEICVCETWKQSLLLFYVPHLAEYIEKAEVLNWENISMSPFEDLERCKDLSDERLRGLTTSLIEDSLLGMFDVKKHDFAEFSTSCANRPFRMPFLLRKALGGLKGSEEWSDLSTVLRPFQKTLTHIQNRISPETASHLIRQVLKNLHIVRPLLEGLDVDLDTNQKYWFCEILDRRASILEQLASQFSRLPKGTSISGVINEAAEKFPMDPVVPKRHVISVYFADPIRKCDDPNPLIDRYEATQGIFYSSIQQLREMLSQKAYLDVRVATRMSIKECTQCNVVHCIARMKESLSLLFEHSDAVGATDAIDLQQFIELVGERSKNRLPRLPSLKVVVLQIMVQDRQASNVYSSLQMESCTDFPLLIIVDGGSSEDFVCHFYSHLCEAGDVTKAFEHAKEKSKPYSMVKLFEESKGNDEMIPWKSGSFKGRRLEQPEYCDKQECVASSLAANQDLNDLVKGHRQYNTELCIACKSLQSKEEPVVRMTSAHTHEMRKFLLILKDFIDLRGRFKTLLLRIDRGNEEDVLQQVYACLQTAARNDSCCDAQEEMETVDEGEQNFRCLMLANTSSQKKFRKFWKAIFSSVGLLLIDATLYTEHEIFWMKTSTSQGSDPVKSYLHNLLDFISTDRTLKADQQRGHILICCRDESHPAVSNLPGVPFVVQERNAQNGFLYTKLRPDLQDSQDLNEKLLSTCFEECEDCFGRFRGAQPSVSEFLARNLLSDAQKNKLCLAEQLKKEDLLNEMLNGMQPEHQGAVLACSLFHNALPTNEQFKFIIQDWKTIVKFYFWANSIRGTLSNAKTFPWIENNQYWTFVSPFVQGAQDCNWIQYLVDSKLAVCHRNPTNNSSVARTPYIYVLPDVRRHCFQILERMLEDNALQIGMYEILNRLYRSLFDDLTMRGRPWDTCKDDWFFAVKELNCRKFQADAYTLLAEALWSLIKVHLAKRIESFPRGYVASVARSMVGISAQGHDDQGSTVPAAGQPDAGGSDIGPTRMQSLEAKVARIRVGASIAFALSDELAENHKVIETECIWVADNIGSAHSERVTDGLSLDLELAQAIALDCLGQVYAKSKSAKAKKSQTPQVERGLEEYNAALQICEKWEQNPPADQLYVRIGQVLHARVRRHLGSYYIHNAKFDRTLSQMHLRKAHELAPDDVFTMRSLAEALTNDVANMLHRLTSIEIKADTLMASPKVGRHEHRMAAEKKLQEALTLTNRALAQCVTVGNIAARLIHAKFMALYRFQSLEMGTVTATEILEQLEQLVGDDPRVHSAFNPKEKWSLCDRFWEIRSTTPSLPPLPSAGVFICMPEGEDSKYAFDFLFFSPSVVTGMDVIPPTPDRENARRSLERCCRAFGAAAVLFDDSGACDSLTSLVRGSIVSLLLSLPPSWQLFRTAQREKQYQAQHNSTRTSVLSEGCLSPSEPTSASCDSPKIAPSITPVDSPASVGELPTITAPLADDTIPVSDSLLYDTMELIEQKPTSAGRGGGLDEHIEAEAIVRFLGHTLVNLALMVSVAAEPKPLQKQRTPGLWTLVTGAATNLESLAGRLASVDGELSRRVQATLSPPEAPTGEALRVAVNRWLHLQPSPTAGALRSWAMVPGRLLLLDGRGRAEAAAALLGWAASSAKVAEFRVSSLFSRSSSTGSSVTSESGTPTVTTPRRNLSDELGSINSACPGATGWYYQVRLPLTCIENSPDGVHSEGIGKGKATSKVLNVELQTKALLVQLYWLSFERPRFGSPSSYHRCASDLPGSVASGISMRSLSAGDRVDSRNGSVDGVWEQIRRWRKPGGFHGMQVVQDPELGDPAMDPTAAALDADTSSAAGPASTAPAWRYMQVDLGECRVRLAPKMYEIYESVNRIARAVGPGGPE